MLMGLFWLIPFFSSAAALALVAFQVVTWPTLGPQSVPWLALAIAMAVVPYVMVRCLQCSDVDRKHRELLEALKSRR